MYTLINFLFIKFIKTKQVLMKFLPTLKLTALLLLLFTIGCSSEEETFISQISGDYSVNQTCLTNEIENQSESYTIRVSKGDFESERRIEVSNFHNEGQSLFVDLDGDVFDLTDYPINIDGKDLLIKGGGEFMVFDNFTSLNLVYELRSDSSIIETCITFGTKI